jgi:hypothetical protein
VDLKIALIHLPIFSLFLIAGPGSSDKNINEFPHKLRNFLKGF